MNFLNMFRNGGAVDTGAGGAKYTNDELLGVYANLTYQDCQNLFRFWPLGKRVIEALPNFAMSAPRTFSFKDYPEELAKRFEEVCLDLGIEKIVRKTAIYTRIYGMAALYIASLDESISPEEPIKYEDTSKGFVFNALDPLSMGGSIHVDLNPLSPTFGQPINVRIRGHKVNPKRVCVIYNDVPLYLKFNPSSFAFTGSSVFQNMTLLIRSLNRSLLALQRAATKGGSIVRTTKEVAHNSGISQIALAKNNEMIRCMENDGIAAINAGESVSFFDIQGIQGIDAIINQINSMLMMALADTPSGILLDKNLSFGLNDGSEDMKAILMAVEHFREAILRPLYNFVDEYVLASAFNKMWLTEFVKLYPDLYRDKSLDEVYELIRQNYEFKFGELYPQTENEQADTESKKLANFQLLSGLGVTRADIETLLNQSGLYNLDFTLEEPISEDGGFGGGGFGADKGEESKEDDEESKEEGGESKEEGGENDGDEKKDKKAVGIGEAKKTKK